MKRLMALLLMLCIALTGMALAEDELYEEVDDSEFNEDAVVPVVGAVYPDKVLSDFDSNSPALYTARMTAYTSGYVERDIESERVFRVGDASARGEVLYIDPTWVIMRYQGNLAYVKRRAIARRYSYFCNDYSSRSFNERHNIYDSIFCWRKQK